MPLIIPDSAKVEVIGATPRKAGYRDIHMAIVAVSPCPQYPTGANLYVMPRQVNAHLKKFPGSRVVGDWKGTARAKPSGIVPVGHGHNMDFMAGKTLHKFEGDGSSHSAAPEDDDGSASD